MKHWDAFCTIFWFATGEQQVALYNVMLGNHMYNWYLEIEDKDETAFTN